MTEDINLQIRAVTDDEIAHYGEFGWVILRGLLAPQLVSDLLARAKSFVNVAGEAPFGVVEERQLEISTDPLFHRFSLAARLGENAGRLMRQPVAIRRWDDRLLVKPPGRAGKATPPHQDDSFRPFHYSSLMYWIALDEVTPDMGTLQYFSGSHKLGQLGAWHFANLDAAVKRYPALAECELTAPQRLAPGDVAVHTGLTVHSAPANTSDRPRWGYRLCYFPADAVFTGESSIYTDGLNLTPKEPFDHPNFPVVYTPAGNPDSPDLYIRFGYGARGTKSR